MTVSVFSIVKNEAQFIGYGIMSLLPYVDEIVYADGNSTDGTLEIIEHIQKRYDDKKKLRVVRGADCKDLKEDYVRLFNDLMKECKGDYLWYCHPDMILTDPGQLMEREGWDFKAAYVHMRSFAGEDMEYEIVKGRTNKWKTIMKNDFGLHYWGYYGHPDEDMYFRAITGSAHKVHKDMNRYPFEVKDLGVRVSHMCECKPRKRREEKMKSVFTTVGGVGGLGPTLGGNVHLFDMVMNHPRVHLQSGKFMDAEFQFVERPDPLPEVFSKHKEEFDKIVGEKITCA